MDEHTIVSPAQNQVRLQNENANQVQLRNPYQHQPQSSGASPDNRHIALVDLLDRLLAGGVVAMGDIELSIADVPLVRISLRAVIASVSTLANETANELIDDHRRDAQGRRR
jgi:hypothetical protein